MGKENSRQDSCPSKFSYARYVEKLFTQIYTDLYGNAVLVPIQIVQLKNCSDSQIPRNK